MLTIDLAGAAFRSQVSGCWMGKNCGGTLGAPLERIWGEPEPFDVWWYPELREGGIPNDDLEMQLIWLKALEQVGPGLRAADLAQYWLDHIGYNWDEYGLSKTNLRLGLLPPVSGAYNNWFKDCMGCPIRSEIWACVAPGAPRIAARYAFEDAICDHAGGESVFGELFNAAVESAAFVVADRERLLDIGLSYVPPWSKTARAILAARQAHAEGLDWKAARRRVLAATPHYNAQFSPINIGFQVVGWLYGADFGDALCIAVNCGYDTDCTGATLGSVLGIIAGRAGLPDRWTAPLGETITTNEPWGGLRHASSGPTPVPTTLDELTERVCRAAQRVLTAHGALQGTTRTVDPADLYADEGVRALWGADPMRVEYALGALYVGISYGDTPAVAPGAEKTITAHLSNPHAEPLAARCTLVTPEGWAAVPPGELVIPPGGAAAVELRVTAPRPALLANSNRLSLAVHAEGRPAQPDLPVVLIGAHRYRYAGPYPADGRDDRELFDMAFDPERAADGAAGPDARPGAWREVWSDDNAVPLQGAFEAPGVIYAQTFLWSPDERAVWIGAATNCPAKLWLNGAPAVASFRYRPIRPNYGGDGESYATVMLRAGWNEALLKFVRGADAPPFDAHLLISSAEPQIRDGQPDIGRTRLPWDR